MAYDAESTIFSAEELQSQTLQRDGDHLLVAHTVICFLFPLNISVSNILPAVTGRAEGKEWRILELKGF